MGDAAQSLHDVCQRVKTLSTQSVLHPSKCRCLALSYSLLIPHVLSLVTSPFLSLRPNLITVLLHTLQRGQRFIQNCSHPAGANKWLNTPGSARNQRHWLINKALSIALGTEIFDVHLHDLVWCVSTLIWALSVECDGRIDVRYESREVEALLKKSWASADDEGDVKCMQELFHNIRPKGCDQICNLICHRLSESTSTARLELTDAVLPTYLWMDPQGFKDIRDHVLGSNESVVVFETRLMGRQFACKHFHRPDSREVFESEALIQARLWHPNVVCLVCCTKGAPAGKSFSLVMELMDQDLGSLIAKRMSAGMDAPFSLLAGVDLMLQIAKGMEYLHNLGIMHRDLKSFNILVSPYLDKSSHLIAKIADFGTSKAKHNISLYTTKRVGTSIWRAPEVLEDEDESKYTRKADVYSFAIICSEILTGLPPEKLLPCAQRSELSKVLKEGRRPKLPSSCPPAISSYIEKCWHGDASERPRFDQICRVLCFFKASILFWGTETPAPHLRDDMFDFEVLQRTAATNERTEGVFYPPVPVLDCLSVLRWIQWKSSSKRGNQLLPDGQGFSMNIILSRIQHSSAEVIGEGCFGSATKCHLEDGFIVVVRRLTNVNIVDRKRFEQQLADMVELRHKNVVPLIAQCSTDDECLLVFQYMTDGRRLSNLLHGSDRVLDWSLRLGVALDAANGINYLHENELTHGHIKSSNIMRIDTYNRWVLADFGMATLAGRVANVGYRAPELTISKKADVYSYGMLLLELVTGLNPEIRTEELEVALSREDQREILDRRMLMYYPDGEEEMMEVLKLARDCLNPNPSWRPAMCKVLDIVERLYDSSRAPISTSAPSTWPPLYISPSSSPSTSPSSPLSPR